MNITDHRLLGVNGAGKTTTMRMITGRKGVVRLMTQNRSRAQQGSRAGVVGKPFTGDTEVTKGDVLVGGASVQAGWSRSWEDVEKWFVGCSFCLTPFGNLGRWSKDSYFYQICSYIFQPGVKPAAGFPVGLFIYIFIIYLLFHIIISFQDENAKEWDGRTGSYGVGVSPQFWALEFHPRCILKFHREVKLMTQPHSHQKKLESFLVLLNYFEFWYHYSNQSINLVAHTDASEQNWKYNILYVCLSKFYKTFVALFVIFTKKHLLGGGNSNIVWCSPRKIGEDEPILTSIFFLNGLVETTN